MNKAIFLDRDGVINKHRKDYVKSITEFVFLPNIEKWVKIFSQHKFKIMGYLASRSLLVVNSILNHVAKFCSLCFDYSPLTILFGIDVSSG